MADLLEQRATRFLGRVSRLGSLLRWASPERFWAILGFASLSIATALRLSLSRLPPELRALVPKSLQPWLPAPFWIVGVLGLFLAALRVIRRVAPPIPEGDTRLPALKGAASFTDTQDDIDLFKQLRRGDEVKELRTWILDDQKPLIVLMGESGAGKTSLLRAGLSHALRRDNIELI